MTEETVTLVYTATQHASMVTSRLLLASKLMMDKKGNEALTSWLFEHYGVISPSEVPVDKMVEASSALREAALAE